MSLKWSEAQTRPVKIPPSIVNDGKKQLSAVVTATQFLGAGPPSAVQLNDKPSLLSIALDVAKPVGVTLQLEVQTRRHHASGATRLSA